jgi:ribose transport system permease protein
LRGGEGSVIGIVIGTALLQVLQNLVNLLGIPSSLNFAVMGAVVLFGVLGDQLLQRRAERKLVGAQEAMQQHKRSLPNSMTNESQVGVETTR